MKPNVQPFAIVVAMDENRGIGKEGKLPWHLPSELIHFAKLTKPTQDPHRKNAVIMGRNTWESLPEKYRPLPQRLNIVLTQNLSYPLPKDVLQANSLEQALQLAEEQSVERIFVIGGAKVFEQALQDPRCQTLHLTQILSSFDCDTFFPSFESLPFTKTFESEIIEEKGIPFRFGHYEVEK